MKRPRIFALTAEPPRMPGSGGEVRTYFFIKMLAELGDLTLVSLGGPSGESKVGDDIANLCRNVIEPGPSWRKKRDSKPTRAQAWLRILTVIAFPWRNNWKEFYLYCIQYLQHRVGEAIPALHWRKRILQSILKTEYRIGARLFDLPPRSVFAYSDKFDAIREQAINALADESFDLIWYEHTHTYPFVDLLLNPSKVSSRPKLVCNAHNIEWLVHGRISKLASNKWEAEDTELQARLIRKLEKTQFNACDLVFVCSEEDKLAGLELAPAADISVVGNGVDTKYFHPGSDELSAKSPMLLFTGTFGYGPNLDALKYFVEQVFPLITAENPKCHFVFAGRDAQKALADLGIDNALISCVSSPTDIRPCFREAWIFVVPLRSGGGTRLKILEAMAIGCPVISTSLGAEGIPAEEGRHWLLADSSTAFAGQVIRLIDDPLLRSHLAQEASTWVRQHYDWDPLVKRASAKLSELLQK